METIYKALRELGMKEDQNCESIRKLGQALSIGASRISELERGTREASLQEMKKYHSYFGVSYDVLMGDKPYDGSEVKINKTVDEALMKSIEEIMFSEDVRKKPDKQTVEFLIGTTTGNVLLRKLSDVLFGVNYGDAPDGEILKDKNIGEYHKVFHEDISGIAKRFVASLMVFRDPKYRVLNSNELGLVLHNSDSMTDNYSKKVQF